MITAKFQSKVRNITLIQCYAPTEKSSVNAKDDFYNLFAATYIPHGDIIVVMGELNVKVGADRTTLELVLGNLGIGIRDDNGERFVDFFNTNHLIRGSTAFEHKPCHKISWVSPNRVEMKIKLTTSPSRDVLEVVYETYAAREAQTLVLRMTTTNATLRLRTAVVVHLRTSRTD